MLNAELTENDAETENELKECNQKQRESGLKSWKKLSDKKRKKKEREKGRE